MSEEPQAHAEAHEEIHMPPNSYWPLVTAIGFPIAMLGVVTLSEMPFVLVIGLLILIVGVAGWVRDARREFSELH